MQAVLTQRLLDPEGAPRSAMVLGSSYGRDSGFEFAFSAECHLVLQRRGWSSMVPFRVRSVHDTSIVQTVGKISGDSRRGVTLLLTGLGLQNPRR